MQRPEIIARIESVIGTCPDLSQLQVLLCGVGAREPNQKTDVEPVFHASANFSSLTAY